MGTGKLKSKLDSSEKTVNLTIRVKKEILDNLKLYASGKETTLNSAVNQLLSQALDWDILAAKAGWVPMPKPALINIMEKLDEKTITEIAESNGKTVPKDFLHIMKGAYSMEAFLDVLKNRSSAAGFNYTEISENDFVKIVMLHDMGIKWSKYFKAYFDSTFKQLGCTAQFSTSENSVIFTVDKKFYPKSEYQRY